MEARANRYRDCTPACSSAARALPTNLPGRSDTGIPSCLSTSFNMTSAADKSAESNQSPSSAVAAAR